MSNVTPFVSIVMAVFNAERFLSQSIESILSQTYEDFEFIIVNDGSSDCSGDIILKYQEIDKRIHLIQLAENQGVAIASNVGVKAAKGKYIARMDSDDISLPDRFSKQVDFLEAHPEIGILGGRMKYISENGKLRNTLPVFGSDLEIHWAFMFESPFYNPTVMFRKSLIEHYEFCYNKTLSVGEDYDLWIRLLPTTHGANLTDVLVQHRINSLSLTHTESKKTRDIRNVKLSTRAVQIYLPDALVTEKEVMELQKAVIGISSSAKKRRAHSMPVYIKIWDAFCDKNANVNVSNLEKKVFAWAARMILYPPFQSRIFSALWLLTKRDWRWPLYLVGQLSYYISRRIA